MIYLKKREWIVVQRTGGLTLSARPIALRQWKGLRARRSAARRSVNVAAATAIHLKLVSSRRVGSPAGGSADAAVDERGGSRGQRGAAAGGITVRGSRGSVGGLDWVSRSRRERSLSAPLPGKLALHDVEVGAGAAGAERSPQ